MHIRQMVKIFILTVFLSKPVLAEFHFEEDHTLPIVYLNVVLDSGSVNDPKGKLGLSAVAANMLLRGTKKNDKNHFFDKLSDIGGTLEIDEKAEGMVIKGGVLTENLEPFLSLIAETIIEPLFNENELKKLKKEIEGELLEQKGNDRMLVVNHFARFYYGDHGYGNPLKGTRKGVASITRKDILKFYSERVGEKNISIFGTGDASESQIKSWFKNLTTELHKKNPNAKPTELEKFDQPHSQKRALVVNKPKATQSQVLLGGPGLVASDEGFYSVMLANHSFGGHSFQARLMQEIRVKRGWTYGASNTYKMGRLPRHFAMHYFPKTADTAPAIALSVSMLKNFVSNGISKDEYFFAKDSLVNNAPFNFDTSKKRLENTTNEYLTGLPHGFFRDFSDNIQKVQYDQILPALQKSIDPENLTLVVVGDAEKLVPAVEKLGTFGKPKVINYMQE